MPSVNRQVPLRSGAAGNAVQEQPSTLKRLRSAWDTSQHIRMLLYGKSGTGKTTLAATFPGPILWLVCSGGNKPGEMRSVDTPEYRAKITPVVVETTGDVCGLTDEACGGGFATVVLDHASGLQDLIIKDLLGLDEIPVTLFRRAGKGESWGLVSQQQYGQVATQGKDMLRRLLGLPCNVVVIAQERTFGDEASSDVITPTVGAALIPSLAGWLAPACDYVVQTYIRSRTEVQPLTVGVGKTAKSVNRTVRVGGVEYCLRTGPDPVYQTKFRLPRGTPLPEVLVDPSYDRIAELVKHAHAGE